MKKTWPEGIYPVYRRETQTSDPSIQMLIMGLVVWAVGTTWRKALWSVASNPLGIMFTRIWTKTVVSLLVTERVWS